MKEKIIIILLLVLCVGLCGCEIIKNNQNDDSNDYSNMYKDDDITSIESNSENISNEIQINIK